MRHLLVCFVLPLAGQDWSLQALYRRPYVWGSAPEAITWAREGHVLVFLWNENGGRFRELYRYDPEARRRVRLTRLEEVRDEFNAGEEEKDEIRRKYVAPAAGVSAFALTRNGSHAVFSWRGDLYLVPTGGDQAPLRLTKTKAVESSPQLAGDARRVAFLRGGQVFLQDLTNGQLIQVTEIERGSLSGFAWSPDGGRIVYRVNRGAPRSQPLPNYSGRFVAAPVFPRNVAGDEPVEAEYWVIGAEGGKPVRLETGTLGPRLYAGLPEWSPDSRRLLLRAVDAGMKKQQIVVIRADTGKATVVAEDSDHKWVFWSTTRWSPDSQHVLFNSERDGWAHLYTVPAEGGEVRQITRGAWEVNESFSLDPNWVDGWIYYASTEAGASERHAYRVRPDGSGKERLSTQEGLNVASVSPDGKHTAWMRADVKNPFDLWVDGERVTRSPRPEFYRYEWPETRFVSFPSRLDGKPVAAKMLLPPGYRIEDRSGRRWPCVFFLHGAGYATSVLKQWGSYNEARFVFNAWLARQGYVIMDLDYRGSSGYGRAWRSDVYLHLGGPDLQDLLGAVDYLRRLGNIDMNRLGLWGVSYGGFLTNMALFQAPGVFRAGASWASVNDWENYNAFYTTQRLNTPGRNPEAYRRSSPIHFSGRLQDALLIVHGMVDNNVLFQDAVQLAEKLIQEGKPFEQIHYPQESHAFVRDESWVDACRRTAELFRRYLQ